MRVITGSTPPVERKTTLEFTDREIALIENALWKTTEVKEGSRNNEGNDALWSSVNEVLVDTLDLTCISDD